MPRCALALAFLVVLPFTASAQDFDAPDPHELSHLFRSLLLPNLPDPLIHTQSNWGKQREVRVLRKKKNDGTWRQVNVTIPNAAQNLRIAMRGIHSPQPGQTLFEVWVGFRANMKFEQQIWESGIRLYSGSTRGHCNVLVRLACELTTRIEPGQNLLPDAVIRVRVTDATLAYTDVEVDHILGIGGDGAKILGNALIEFMRDVKPNLERDMLGKANQAIVKAGDSKEVRLSFEKLLKGEFPKVPIGR